MDSSMGNSDKLSPDEFLTVSAERLTLTGFLQLLPGLRSFTLCVVYLVLVYLSRFWTRYTKPMTLTKLMLAYNAICVMASTLVTVRSVIVIWAMLQSGAAGHAGLFSVATTPDLQEMYRQYFLLKVWELLDTVFMVVRHRRRQISFLHVFHHASMLLLSDFAASVSPWLAMSPVLGLNSLIHVCLYTYYGLVGAGVSVPQTWRRRLTEAQIAQFVAGLAYTAWGYAHHSFCMYSMLYGLSMLVLFGNFYRKAYLVRHQVSVNGSAKVNGAENKGNGTSRKTA